VILKSIPTTILTATVTRTASSPTARAWIQSVLKKDLIRHSHTTSATSGPTRGKKRERMNPARLPRNAIATAASKVAFLPTTILPAINSMRPTSTSAITKATNPASKAAPARAALNGPIIQSLDPRSGAGAGNIFRPLGPCLILAAQSNG